jgi:hypothetical protein
MAPRRNVSKPGESPLTRACIMVPKDLKEKMEEFTRRRVVNWSLVATKAFRAKVKELAKGV